MMEINSRNLDEIIQYASSVKATDIHIIVNSKPVVRVNKSLEEIEYSDVITKEIAESLAYSCMNEKQKRIFEDEGEVDFSFSRDGVGRYRANVFKQKGVCSMALRAIPYSIPEFDDLALPTVVRSFANMHKGLVLVTGATGSGKSTTLASILNIINSERKTHIITVEDPIEYIHTHKKSRINQREIGTDTKSFASALRAALREDPEVILVGEMRDPETVSIALSAAETGHLVFSTLHTVGAAKTIDRIIDVFPAEKHHQIRSQLSTVLSGVVSQELIPRSDRKGIVAACEVMIVSPAIKNLIREGKPHQIPTAMQTSAHLGMQTLDSHMANLVSRGIISKEQALMRAQDEQGLMNLLDRR